MPETDTEEKLISRREYNSSWKAHDREHEFHTKLHEVEHTTKEKATIKSEEQLDKRLEGMNAFRAQLAEQNATFMLRETFERFKEETKLREEFLLREAVTTHEKIDASVEIERQARIRLEAQIGTVKTIVFFIGAPGVIALLWRLALTVSGVPPTNP